MDEAQYIVRVFLFFSDLVSEVRGLSEREILYQSSSRLLRSRGYKMRQIFLIFLAREVDISILVVRADGHFDHTDYSEVMISKFTECLYICSYICSYAVSESFLSKVHGNILECSGL